MAEYSLSEQFGKQLEGDSRRLELANSYFMDIREIALLSPKDEHALMKKVQQAKHNFYSYILRNNESIQFVLDAYQQNNSSLLKLSKFFRLANSKERSISLDEVRKLFVKNMNEVKSIVNENKSDCILLKILSNKKKRLREGISARIEKRINKAVTLIEELGFKENRLLEKKYPDYKKLHKMIHQYRNTKTRERVLKFNPLVRKSFVYFSDIADIKTYVDKLIPLYNKYVKFRNEMVQANLRLVISIAKKMSSNDQELSFLDAVQSGNLGLMRAVDKCNSELGLKFSTYATHWIKHAIREFRLSLHDSNDYLNQKNNNVKKKFTELKEKLGRNPTAEEIAKELGAKTSTVKEIIHRIRTKKYSIDVPYYKDKYGEEVFSLEIEDKSEPVDYEKKVLEMRKIIKQAMMKLIKTEKSYNTKQNSGKITIYDKCEMLLMRYGFESERRGATFQEISDVFNISRERVRQIINSLEKKLWPILIEFGVTDYLTGVDEENEGHTNSGDCVIFKKPVGIA